MTNKQPTTSNPSSKTDIENIKWDLKWEGREIKQFVTGLIREDIINCK